MQLSLQTFATMVRTQAAAAKASCAQVTDTSVGSVLRAIFEANASVGLWIQWLMTQVLSTTRAATSSGEDLDSWVADFGMSRLPASAAAGLITCSRLVPGLATVIPIGALVRTGTALDDQVFEVTADPSNAAWAGTGYSVSADVVSVDVPIAAQTAGAAGNVRAGVISQLSSAIPGIDAVSNHAAMSGGLDAESDTALRQRFAGFLDSRTRATTQAVGFAIQSVRQGISYTILDRVDASGASRAGHFTVTLDDGTGSPSTSLIASVAAAVEQVRPLGATFSIRGPIVIPVQVTLQGVGSPSALNNAQSAILAYISALPIGGSLTISRLYQVAHDADPTISSVSGAMINGNPLDLTPPIFGLLRPSNVQVTT